MGHYGWGSAGDVTMPAWGLPMMSFGIFFTLLVGGGLMALIFYNNRAGFAETSELELPPEAKRRPAMRKRR